MISKVSLVLFGVVIVSVLLNIFLLQQTTSLQGILDDTEMEKQELEKKLLAFSDTNVESEPEINQSLLVQSNVKKEEGSVLTESITAVGVRPILLRDGFFERVRYEGTTMDIQVSIRNGQGLVLVNTAIPTGVDFQTSAKTAVRVAEDYLDQDLSDKDIVFSISAENNENLKTVDGKSAGAAMTVLLISELQGKEISQDIVMTGTILSDGSIGKVGGISEKAEAAGKNGSKLFLVPKGQGITYIESCQESKTGTILYRSCTLEEKPLSPITEAKFGMKVFEVENIGEALRFFT